MNPQFIKEVLRDVMSSRSFDLQVIMNSNINKLILKFIETCVKSIINILNIQISNSKSMININSDSSALSAAISLLTRYNNVHQWAKRLASNPLSSRVYRIQRVVTIKPNNVNYTDIKSFIQHNCDGFNFDNAISIVESQDAFFSGNVSLSSSYGEGVASRVNLSLSISDLNQQHDLVNKLSLFKDKAAFKVAKAEDVLFNKLSFDSEGKNDSEYDVLLDGWLICMVSVTI